MRGDGLFLRGLKVNSSLALLALSIAACAPRPPADALNCTGTFRICTLKQGTRLQGVALGMTPHEAFRQVCSGQLSRALSDPYFTTYSSTVGSEELTPEDLRPGPVRCEDETFSARADFWEFDSSLGVCSLPRREKTTMRFVEGRLARVEIGCGVVDF